MAMPDPVPNVVMGSGPILREENFDIGLLASAMQAHASKASAGPPPGDSAEMSLVKILSSIRLGTSPHASELIVARLLAKQYGEIVQGPLGEMLVASVARILEVWEACAEMPDIPSRGMLQQWMSNAVDDFYCYNMLRIRSFNPDGKDWSSVRSCLRSSTLHGYTRFMPAYNKARKVVLVHSSGNPQGGGQRGGSNYHRGGGRGGGRGGRDWKRQREDHPSDGPGQPSRAQHGSK